MTDRHLPLLTHGADTYDGIPTVRSSLRVPTVNAFRSAGRHNVNKVDSPTHPGITQLRPGGFFRMAVRGIAVTALGFLVMAGLVAWAITDAVSDAVDLPTFTVPFGEDPDYPVPTVPEYESPVGGALSALLDEPPPVSEQRPMQSDPLLPSGTSGPRGNGISGIIPAPQSGRITPIPGLGRVTPIPDGGRMTRVPRAIRPVPAPSPIPSDGAIVPPVRTDSAVPVIPAPSVEPSPSTTTATIVPTVPVVTTAPAPPSDATVIPE